MREAGSVRRHPGDDRALAHTNQLSALWVCLLHAGLINHLYKGLRIAL